MTPNDLHQAMTVLKTVYTREITAELAEVWLAMFGTVPTEVFVYALHQHMTDPDEGRWFPAPAHVLRHIIGTEADAAARYGIEFDNSPGCDGTISFDYERETIPQRAGRRKNWIAENLARWRTASSEQKIAHALQQKSWRTKLNHAPRQIGQTAGAAQ